MENKRCFLVLEMILATHLCVDIMVFNDNNLNNVAISLSPSKKNFNYENINYTIDFVNNRNWFLWNLHFFLIIICDILVISFSYILKSYSNIQPLLLLSILSIILIVLTLLIHYKIRPTLRMRLLKEKRIIIKKNLCIEKERTSF